MTVISEEVPQYEIKCWILHRSTVTVEAHSEEEAIEKFNSLDWIDDGLSGVTISDFKMLEKPRLGE